MTDTYDTKAAEILDEALRENSAHPIGLRKHQIRLIAAQLRSAGDLLRVLKEVAPKFQSYEECDATHCKTSHDYPIRDGIDKAIADAELAGITTP